MVFILETYPLQICLLLGLGIVSVILVPIWLWLPAIRHLRARFLGENRSAKALISAIFLLTLPSLAVWESFTLSIAAQHAPCRLVYSSNMDAPLPSSVLLAINEQGSGTPALAVVRARDGATQWGQHNSSTSFSGRYSPLLTETSGVISFFSADEKLNAQQVAQLGNTGENTGSLNVEKLTETYQIHHPYAFTLAQNSLYLFSTTQADTYTDVYQDLNIISIDIHTGDLQWKRNFRVSTYTDPTPIQISRFGTHLYLHGGPTLFALDALNGTTRWQIEVGYAIGAGTVEAENAVYAPGEANNGRAAMYALNPMNGRQIWQCTNFGFGAQFSALGLYHGVLFANSQKVFPHYYDFMPQFSEPANALFALSTEDGSVYWRNTSVDG